MGVNKDKNLDLSQSYIGKTFETVLKPKMSENDLRLYYQMIAEVNEAGYHIQDESQLQALDKEDKCLIPIIMRYVNRFDYSAINNTLLTSMGKRGFTELTDFYVEEFKKPNNQRNGWNFTRRWAISNALLEICDKTKEDAYIDLLVNKDTRNDCVFIILLLGKIKSEKAVPYLVETLQDENYELQSFTIKALGYYKNHPELIEKIEPFLNSDNPAFREHARDSLKKLRKAKEKQM